MGRFRLGCMSVQDPLDPGNNVTHSVNENSVERIGKIFAYGEEVLEGLHALDYSSVAKPEAHCTRTLFPTTPWILEKCAAIDRANYKKIFDVENLDENRVKREDLMSGDMTLFQRFVKFFHYRSSAGGVGNGNGNAYHSGGVNKKR